MFFYFRNVMRQSVIKHIRAVLILPFTVTLVVPALILYGSEGIRVHWGYGSALKITGLIAGGVLICSGLMLLIGTIRRFSTEGRGTLAPWNPTEQLVVRGIYRYVRNPMISGVIMILLGEAIVTGSFSVLLWGLFFLIFNMVYIPLSEEPGLGRRFGDDYLRYKRNVPRWIPRLKPWDSNQDTVE